VLISHNLAVVEQLCEETAVLYLGRIVEHDATEGPLADPADPPPGCPFHPRCPYANDLTRTVVPELRSLDSGRTVACHRAEEILTGDANPAGVA
jgi:peptide/nickel transport system ATP-binding protein